jgi:hypothetical protein
VVTGDARRIVARLTPCLSSLANSNRSTPGSQHVSRPDAHDLAVRDACADESRFAWQQAQQQQQQQGSEQHVAISSVCRQRPKTAQRLAVSDAEVQENQHTSCTSLPTWPHSSQRLQCLNRLPSSVDDPCDRELGGRRTDALVVSVSRLHAHCGTDAKEPKTIAFSRHNSTTLLLSTQRCGGVSGRETARLELFLVM